MGYFPIFVDTTGSDLSRFKKRVEILEGIGYDTSLIVIHTSLDQALANVEKRNNVQSRKMSVDDVTKNWNDFNRVESSFKNVISDHVVINNDGYPDKNADIAYKIMMNRLNSPIKNNKGKILLDYMKKNGILYYNETPLEWREENGYPNLDRVSVQWFRS